MNLQNQSYTCPVVNGKYPANCEELQSMLIDMYLSGQISDNDPEYVYQRNLQICKDKLAELGHNDEYVDYLKKAYYETYKINDKKTVVDDDEEQQILNEYKNLKISKK